MATPKSSFLGKVLDRIGRLDKEGLQSVVERLARERSFLETLFNTIEDGVLVLDETGRILYYNQAILTLLAGQNQFIEGQPIDRLLPELDWATLAARRVNAWTRSVSMAANVFARASVASWIMSAMPELPEASPSKGAA